MYIQCVNCTYGLYTVCFQPLLPERQIGVCLLQLVSSPFCHHSPRGRRWTEPGLFWAQLTEPRTPNGAHKVVTLQSPAPCGTSDITLCVYVCLGRWGVCICTVDTTQGNLFVSAFLFADVCLCAHTHTRAHGGHNQLQMILSVCQLPRIAALVFWPWQIF